MVPDFFCLIFEKKKTLEKNPRGISKTILARVPGGIPGDISDETA